jgi:hypothetical protein
MFLAPYVRAHIVAKGDRASPGASSPPNRPRAPPGRGNHFARLNAPGRPNGANLAGAHNAFMLNNRARPFMAPALGDTR